MDFLPIKPSSTNKVNSALNLSNDGGSKSNTGYFSQRGQEEASLEKVDELSLSTSVSEENEEVEIETELQKFFSSVRNLMKKIKEFILELLGFDKPKIENIYKESNEKV